MVLPIRKDDLLSIPLQRTTYRDPEGHGEPVRTETIPVVANAVDVSCNENALDMDEYYRPLTAIHGAALHGPGVASGMGVQATIGSPGVTVLPGVALDSGGRHICLISGGVAEIGPKADVPGTPQNLVPVKDPVNAPPGGVTLPTTGLSPGPNYLTVEFGERFDEGGTATGAYRYDHTPWLRLLPTAGYDVNDRSRIILASVMLGTGPNLGTVTGLTQEARQINSLSATSVRLTGSQGTTSGSQKSVADIPVGAIRPRDTGGLLIETSSLGVQPDGGPEKITIDGTSGSATLAYILVRQDATILGRFSAETVSSTHETTVGGTFYAASAVVTDDAAIGGKVSAGSAGITGDTTIGGKVSAGSAGITGDTTIGGTVTAGNAAITNDAAIGGKVSAGTAGITGDTTIGGTVSAGNAAITNDAAIGGKVSAGTVGITGDMTIGGTVTAGNAAITNDAGIGGTVVITKDAAIGGKVSAGSVAISGADPSGYLLFVSATSGFAADFVGAVSILGKLAVSDDIDLNGNSITGGSKAFKIDHPLDPANKFLLHSSIESPDMMNIYNGNVTTDEQGKAVVVLPDYFEALNSDFRYQLTVIGELAVACVSEEIQQGRFCIKSDRANVRISWQVTGIRRDPYALANRIRVEEDKPEAERGLYLHPDLYGQPEQRSLFKNRRSEVHATRPSSSSAV